MPVVVRGEEVSWCRGPEARGCCAYEVIVYIERRYLVMIVRWMGNHANTCGAAQWVVGMRGVI